MSKKNTLIILAVFLLVLFVLVLVKIPYKIKTPCRFLAQAEWSLQLNQTEKFFSRYTENIGSLTDQFDLLQFDRLDFVSFRLNPGFEIGQWVQRDDSVGSIYSSENHLRLADLKTRLLALQAELRSIKSGEKASVKAEAQKALEYARAQLAAFKPEFERKKELRQRHLISQQDFEQAEATLRLYRINVDLHNARVSAVKTGEKQEQIDVVRAQLKGLYAQIDLVEEKISNETIVTPISGVITNPRDSTMLCRVEKLDTLVCFIPVPEHQIKYVQIGQRVSIQSNASDVELPVCSVDEIGNRVYFINARPTFIVKSVLKNPDLSIQPGSTGQTAITGPSISLLQLLKRSFARRF